MPAKHSVRGLPLGWSSILPPSVEISSWTGDDEGREMAMRLRLGIRLSSSRRPADVLRRSATVDPLAGIEGHGPCRPERLVSS